MLYSFFFFFNDTATTEIYTLSLHDALPICDRHDRLPQMLPIPAPAGSADVGAVHERQPVQIDAEHQDEEQPGDRKSTRLNSSHANISYAVFCLKKNKITTI